MISDLVLVVPPSQGLLEGFSSGLLSLANYIDQKQPSVRVRLADLSSIDTELIRLELGARGLLTDDAPLVGITTTTATYQSALKVARAFKHALPTCYVVFGGPHASAQDDVILEHHHSIVDYVIRGEGERSLLDLVQKLPDAASVFGVSYRREGTFHRNPPAPLLSQDELDALPPLFRGSQRFCPPGKLQRATYVSARGCPLKCSFCAVANERIRSKSVKAVVSDLRLLLGECGYSRITIEDNFFAHSPRRTLELCAALAALQHEFPFAWDCQTRVESLKRSDVIKALEEAGCDAVFIGVEDLDPDQLLYLQKTSSPETYLANFEYQVVPSLLASSIECYINIQVGLPNEKPHRTLAVLHRLGRLALASGKSITVFPQLHVTYPGTKQFYDAVDQQEFGENSRAIYEEFTAWESVQEPVLTWLGEHFAHGTGGIPQGILHANALRYGRFEIDANAVQNIVNYLDAMYAVPGITVFNYGGCLIKSDAESGPNKSFPVHN